MCYLPHTNIIDLALLESWNLSACQGRSWFKLWLPRKAQNQRHRLYHKVRRGAENLYGEQLASLLGKLNQEVSILEARRVGNRCHIRNVEQVWWLPLYYDIPFSWLDPRAQAARLLSPGLMQVYSSLENWLAQEIRPPVIWGVPPKMAMFPLMC